jgi:hypothetical protein
MKRIPKDMKLWSLGVAVILTASLGLFLATKSFRQPGAPGQAFVTVFTKERTASVSLKAVIRPFHPWQDWLTVRINGVHGVQERWLLVVQCPAAPAAPAHTVALYPEAGSSLPGASVAVTVSPHVGKSWGGYLICFRGQARRNSSNGASGFAYATLPALEIDPAMAAAQEPPQLYAERDNSSHRIKELFEVFPECQAVSPTAATISPAPTGMTSQRPVVGTPGGLPPTASPPTVSTTSSPNPEASGCSSPQSLGATPDVYQLPASVVATEILHDVNLSGYRIDSMFPPGHFGESGQITWQGISSLSPSLLATNVTAEHRLGLYTFLSGVVFGICGGAVIALLVEGFDASRERRKKKEEEKKKKEKGSAVAEKQG